MVQRTVAALVVLTFLGPVGCEDYDQQRRDRQHQALKQRFEREKAFETAFKACRAYLSDHETIDEAKLGELAAPFVDEPQEAVLFLTQPSRSLEGGTDSAGSALYLAAKTLAGFEFDRSSRLSNIPKKTKTRLKVGMGVQEISRQIELFLSRRPAPSATWQKRMEEAKQLLSQKQI